VEVHSGIIREARETQTAKYLDVWVAGK